MNCTWERRIGALFPVAQDWPSLSVIERPYPRVRWALFRGTKHSSHTRRSTSHVFAGGAPGARTLNPRMKSGPLGRAVRSTCTEATRGRTESTHRTVIRPALEIGRASCRERV